MTVSKQGSEAGSGSLIPWDPNRFVRQVDGEMAKLSRGFLRCRPEKWFPGFGAHWLPLAHSLGVEMKIIEVKPVMTIPKGLDCRYCASIDDEPAVFSLDNDSANQLVEVVSPGSKKGARGVVLEYLARRFIASVAASWSGPESSVVRFHSEMNPDQVRHQGAVRVTASVGGQNCTVWVGLGKLLVERLDGLWRRQVQASARQGAEDSTVRVVVGQLAVPPSMLSEYVKSQTVVDLEVLVSDAVTLHVGGKPWLPAKLCNIDGKLGFEITSGPIAAAPLPEGTTRLAIEFGSLELDAGKLSEISQAGATCATDIDLSDQVALILQGEEVARGTLCTYEGRFAVSVQ